MKNWIRCSVLVLHAGIAAAQVPSISNIVNAASGIAAGLPNSGIAEGSIFLIFGSNLGPSALTIAPNPFQSGSVGGTSARVVVNGTSQDVLLYYTSASQIAGLLPSNTPVGTGTITLTYNGSSSAPMPITVVRNNPGIFTAEQNGSGPGILTYADYSVVTASKSANPGETLVLWATGLGPVNGDTDPSQLGVDMPDIPLRLWLGGIEATVKYRGRSGCCFGEDQIVFTVPQNAPVGCAVPLSLQVGNEVSNSTSLPIAAGGRICTTTNPVFASPSNPIVPKLLTGVPFNYAQVELRHQINPTAIGYNDNVAGLFGKFVTPLLVQPFSPSLIDYQPLGNCVVFNVLTPPFGPPFALLGGLDVGPSLAVNGPGGLLTVSVLNPFLSLTGTYLVPGKYTVSAAGGRDLGPFTTSVTIPPEPVWKDLSPPGIYPSIDRSQGVTFSWTGGEPGSIVQIDGGSATDSTFTKGAVFSCLTAAEVGSQFVPPSVLLALPVGSNAYLNFKVRTIPAAFSASNLDVGLILATIEDFAITSYR